MSYVSPRLFDRSSWLLEYCGLDGVCKDSFSHCLAIGQPLAGHWKEHCLNSFMGSANEEFEIPKTDVVSRGRGVEVDIATVGNEGRSCEIGNHYSFIS